MDESTETRIVVEVIGKEQFCKIMNAIHEQTKISEAVANLCHRSRTFAPLMSTIAIVRN